ncbi:MAG TPA: hypothetical protein VFV92_00030, partial [Candidatus Bathyarchaeia archaeon]|nr:hypothetical protein [Candidatus Bathyarchaeia archaeon]
GTPAVLSGHYDCHETLIANCGTVSASFAYLVVAIGAALFAVYAVRLRGRSPGLSEELAPESVEVDKEGWETKTLDSKKQKGKKSFSDERGKEQKSDG